MMDYGQAITLLLQRAETAETFPRKTYGDAGCGASAVQPACCSGSGPALSEATRRSHRTASTSNGRGRLFRDARW